MICISQDWLLMHTSNSCTYAIVFWSTDFKPFIFLRASDDSTGSELASWFFIWVAWFFCYSPIMGFIWGGWAGHSACRFSSSICFSWYACLGDIHCYRRGAITDDTGAGVIVEDLCEKIQVATGTTTSLLDLVFFEFVVLWDFFVNCILLFYLISFIIVSIWVLNILLV